MSAYIMNDQIMLNSQRYNSEYHQFLMRAVCNFPEHPQPSLTAPPDELDCEMELLNADLWKQFHELGTEMIITKSGRRMFPSLSVQVKGLKDGEQYAVAVEMCPVGGARWRRAGGVWAAGGSQGGAGHPPAGAALHPDGPAPASRWAQPINFTRLKLTNNVHDTAGNIVLTSMCKYQPRIRVMRVGGGWPAQKCFTFPETEFIAVTAYQNEQITQLKIDNNPFAKGFRKCGQGRCKRKMRSESPDSEKTSEDSASLKMSSSGSSPNRPPSRELRHQSDPLRLDIKDSSLSEDLSKSTEPFKSPRSDISSEIESPANRDLTNHPEFCSRSSLTSPTRPPSISSESSYQLSIGSPTDDAVPQCSQHDMRYAQLAEWAHCVMYNNPLWMSPLPGLTPGYPYSQVSVPFQPLPMWHQPLPAPYSPPTPACRPREQHPKGGSFTIRALIGEN